MSAGAYLLQVVSGERRGPDAAVLRAGLGALSYAYVGGLELYLLPYRLGLRKQHRLPCAVVSVGNLTVGGTGKTPMTQRVCEFLRERGIRVCVLSRGHRGAHEHGAAIVSTERRIELDAAAAGDEAHLLAQLLPGVPVLVGKDRRRTGALAVETFAPQVLVLDDGMQFYQLHRDLDVALVDALRPFDNQWTFPRGLMREPPSHLRRADCVVITNSDKVDGPSLERLRARVGRLAPRTPVYAAHYEARSLRALDRSGERPVDWLCGRRVAALSAVGNPEGFEAQLAAAGADVVTRVRQPDHHAATMGELQDVIARATADGAEAIVVTEKDAVKLPPLGRPLPFLALVVRQRLDDEAGFFAGVMGALGDRWI